MFGWERPPAERASCLKRAENPASELNWGRRSLTATSRSSCSSTARQIVAIPPSPRGAISRYRPLISLPIISTRSVSQVESADVSAELVGILRLESERHVGLQPPEARAGIVARALELVAEDRLLADQSADRIGQLDLAAGATAGLLEDVEDLRGQDVSAKHCEVGWGVVDGRLLDEVADLDQAALLLERIHDAVARHLLAPDALDGNHRPAVRDMGVDELPGDRVATGVEHHVVRQEHGERLVAHEILRHQHRVAEAELLPLVDERDGAELADAPDGAQHLDVAALLQPPFERRVRVEVVLDRAASGGDHDDDLLDSRRHRLLDRVLDDRSVDERHHLLGDRLRRREESGAESRRGQDGFSYAHSDREAPCSGVRQAADGCSLARGEAAIWLLAGERSIATGGPCTFRTTGTVQSRRRC